MKVIAFKWFTICLGAYLFLPAVLQAQEKPLKIRVNYTAPDISQAPIWMAHVAGLYRKHGLDAEVIFLRGTPLALQVLSAGEVDLTVAVAETVVRANLKGASLVMILGYFKKFPLCLLTQPTITHVNQLRGKKIAVGRFGSLPHTAIRHQLKHWGFEDVELVQMSLDAAPAALKAGQLDGGVFVAAAECTSIKKAGFHELFSFTKDGPEFLTLTVTTTTPFLKKNEDAVRRFVKAYIEASHLVKTDKERTLRAAPKYMRLTDRQALEDSYAQIVPYLAPIPTIGDADVSRVLSVIAEIEPSARQGSPSAMYEMKYVRELEESGFIQAVLGAQPRK